MEAKQIIAAVVKSNQSDNNVWAVSITGEEQPASYCKSAYKAMRFMFMLKKQTGFSISGTCLSELSKTIAMQKAEKEADKAASPAEVVEQPAEEPKPKPKRKPRTRKSNSNAAAPV